MKSLGYILFCLCLLGCSKPNYEDYKALAKGIQKNSQLFKMTSPDVYSKRINDETYSEEDKKNLLIILNGLGVSKSDFDEIGLKMKGLNISLFHVIDDNIFFITSGGLGEVSGYVMVGTEVDLTKEYRIDTNYIVQVVKKCEGNLYYFST